MIYVTVQIEALAVTIEPGQQQLWAAGEEDVDLRCIVDEIVPQSTLAKLQWLHLSHAWDKAKESL